MMLCIRFASLLQITSLFNKIGQVINKTMKKIVAFIFSALFSYSPILAQNAISIENALTGTPQSQWDVSGAGDLSIQGFATDISVNAGDTVKFKIKTNASAYTVTIYRLGYYQGNGACLKGTGVITASLPQTQPVDLYDTATGLTDCSNWGVSAYWLVPSNAVSGVYLAKLTRTDNNGASHIVFIVRNDNSTANILFKTADATWQAYNNYGGNSLYVNNSGIAVPGFNHATKVSYNRPFYTRAGGGGGGASEDWVMNAEYPMIRWLERNGYDVTYTTDVDMDRSSVNITPAKHKMMMSVGHDEYWSAAQRTRFENARNAGVHLTFFSGNEVYWKTRWEDNHRTLVCYKEGTLGENVCGTKCDPAANTWTGLWRDGCAYPLADGCNPENALTGQISWDGTTTSLLVPSDYKNLRFWRNTTVAALGTNQTATFPNGTLGYEWDWEQAAYASSNPSGRIKLSQTTFNGHTHHLVLYRHTSGALVFGAGTVQWSWGLDSLHDRGNASPDVNMQQATVNLFAEMGIQPASIQSGLLTATATGDVTAPVSAITFPTNPDTVQANATTVITGTASDAGVVAAIDVSVDGGNSWSRATGTTSWSYSWTPTAIGTVNIKTRAIDDWGNIETPSSGISVLVSAQPCPCSVFPSSAVPASVDNRDNTTGIELGMKFKSNVNGYISAVRFYKGSLSNGTFTGHIWASNGNSLAVATLNVSSGSGWQQINLSTPLAITANTTYVVSYHSPSGYYPITNPSFSSAFINGPLRGLANGEDGPNGVYNYTATPAFPSSNYQSSNYWVDVVFDTAIVADVTPPIVVSTVPANSATGVSIGSSVVINFSENVDTATLNSNTVQLKDAGNNVVSATLTKASNHVTIVPSAALAYSTNYSILIKGGSTDPRLKDVAGNALAADYTASFTTESVPANQGPGGPILVVSSAANPFSRYTTEILKAEGLNEFLAMDISLINASVLTSYDIVVLGEVTLTSAQVTLLTNWVTAGGTLIALKPDAQLLPLLGLASAGGSLSNKYLLVNTSTSAGTGIVNQTIQYHGTANQYNLNGATALATLYSDAITATAFPAVTSKNVGSAGGQAIAFAYDLNKSIVYTRQGNPAWSGDERDGLSGPIRSNDLFFGNKTGDVQPDWIDLNKVAIPQADEQQRFLVNIILKANSDRKPLPRFWYFPKGLKAAVIMTGDDHGNGGTIARFNQYKTLSSSNTATAVEDWLAIRGSSYIYTNTPITNTQVVNFQNDGFEIGLHVNTGCSNYTQSSLTNDWNSQYATFTSNFSGVSSQKTNRTHCVAWSDWATQAKVQAARGIRLDVNYYYYPDSWIQNRPGMFTGSGMPMRFADLDGTLIDCYQVATQLTDESGQTITTHINTLLDNAIGAAGYYGAFCANMHTDNNTSTGSDDIIASAQARNIPVIAASQLLKWLDGKETSSFGNLNWANNRLSFNITAGTGSKHLKGMLPMQSNGGVLDTLYYNNAQIAYTTETIKGISYAFFDATLGSAAYVADYNVDTVPPVVSNINVVANASGEATITWVTNEAAKSRVDYDTVSTTLANSSVSNALVTNHSLTLTGLTANKIYYFRVTSADESLNSTTSPLSPAPPLNFIVPLNCFVDLDSANFASGTATNLYIAKESNGELILQPGKVAEFHTLPSNTEWDNFPWTGGTSVISNGQLLVNGARYNTQPIGATFGPGSSLEFLATFGAAAFQHIGFGGGSDANGTGGIYNGDDAWAMFSTGNTTNSLLARTYIPGSSSNNYTITGINNLIGSPHLFRIDWKSDGSFEYYIDGNLVLTEPLIISTQMRPAMSDYNNDGISLTTDWIRVSPYAASGTLESRVYDGGVAKKWDYMSWTAETPTNTSIVMQCRTGNVAVPDGTWTTYSTVAASGNNINLASRYIQYKATLTSTSTQKTPKLKDVSIACSEVVLPTVSLNPDSTLVCENTNAMFRSLSTANPEATVQWQVSANGGSSWSNLSGATNDTLTFTATLADTNKLYRAVWSNVGGATTSSTALLKVSATGTWVGGTSTDWSNVSNWCGGSLPNNTNNVTIAADADFMPTIDAGDTLRSLNLLVETGATLTINGTLSVAGNIINNGTLNGTQGNLYLNGTVSQQISGNAITIKNMKLDNTAGAVLSTPLGITETYTPEVGTLIANGNLTILSSASGTGRIGTFPLGADITGNVAVQRYVPAVTRRSRMIAPNTASFNFSQLQDNIFITGPSGVAGGFDFSAFNQNTVYTYQESTSGGRGWKSLSNITNTLAPGLGALVFIRGDRTIPAPAWYTSPFVPQNEVTLDFYGPVNKGDISPTITYTNTNDADNDGWNMVGNPYPSQIDWNAVNKSNLANFYYVFNPATGSYVADNGTNLIASGQAFFVQAIGASPTITFTEACKVEASPTSYFKTANPSVKVTLVKDSLNADELKIEFAVGSSSNYNAIEDALKLTNATVNVGVWVNNKTKKLQYHKTPPLNNATDTIHMFVDASNGTYQLLFAGIQGIPSGYGVFLKDAFTNMVQNLRSNSQYAFNITSNVNSKGANRFQLLFINPSLLPVEWLNFSAYVDDNDDVQLNWMTATEKNNKGFLLERTEVLSDKENWQTLAFIKGNGNSNTIQQYLFTDAKAFKNGQPVLFYRIKQLDVSGRENNSKVVAVYQQQANNQTVINVYPNPFDNEVNLLIHTPMSQAAEMELFDGYGKSLYKGVLELKQGEQHINIAPLRKVEAGVYLVVLTIGNERFTFKVTKL